MCKDLLRLEPVTSKNIAEPVPLVDAAVIQMSLSFMRVVKILISLLMFIFLA
jgi:hypothetical protein